MGSAGVVDVDGMTAPAERALARFEQAVERAGGAIELKSAYRPQSYQQHLEQVWDKWMIELRSNTEPGCQDLRAQAGEEFARHHLIETQRPVPVSDHTRGIAFDALVTLPAGARLKRRRVNVDYLARISGVGRPAIASDPVHFRLLGGRKSRSA